MSPPVVTAAAPVIEIRDLSTRYGDREIHRNLNLEVRHGEIFGLVGGSGSGKSTLLREVILLKRPSSGSIRLFGMDITSMSEAELLPLRRRYGVVFQQGALFGTLTVLENVALPLREYARLSPRLVEEIAAIKIGLSGLPPASADLRPDALSGGMQKRAALARALALDPELLLLDEPTSGLDPASSGKLADLLRELRDLLGLTMLLVTHDTKLLWRAADRVAFLAEGRITATGRVDELASSDLLELREFFGVSGLPGPGG